MEREGSLPLVYEYFGGLAHVHTRLSNHRGHHESNLTRAALIHTLKKAGLAGARDAPLQYVMFNEHPSNPNNPRILGLWSVRSWRLLKQRRRAELDGVPLLYGLEVSILADGKIDLSPRLADNCDLVIASRHRLPHKTEAKAESIMTLFARACSNPVVDVIGHPTRYIESVDGVDWTQFFEQAAMSGTAVEVNLNIFPDRYYEPERYEFWEWWLGKLGSSGAKVFIGTDIHNFRQLKRFIGEWTSLNQPNGSNRVNNCAQALEKSGIGPERVVTATLSGFRHWLTIDKTTRSQVSSAKAVK